MIKKRLKQAVEKRRFQIADKGLEHALKAVNARLAAVYNGIAQIVRKILKRRLDNRPLLADDFKLFFKVYVLLCKRAGLF